MPLRELMDELLTLIEKRLASQTCEAPENYGAVCLESARAAVWRFPPLSAVCTITLIDPRNPLAVLEQIKDGETGPLVLLDLELKDPKTGESVQALLRCQPRSGPYQDFRKMLR